MTDNLQIFSIEMKDYRQYAGEQLLELETDADRHINIIEGENGAGKSNLLNAITLCFYDTEEHLADRDDIGLDQLPKVNRKRMSDVEPKGQAKGYVKITLGHDQPEYIFKREFTTVKLSDGAFSSSTGELKLHHKKGEDWKPVENPHTYLNEILPTRVKDYFLFDGEDLDGFFEEGYTSRVEDAILDVSHVELLNRALDHIGKVQTDIERDGPNAKGKVESLREDYEEEQAKLEQEQEQKAQYEEQIEDTETNISKLDKKLKDSRNPDVQKKQQRRQDLKERLAEKKEQLEQRQKEAHQTLLMAGQVVYAQDALEFTRDRFVELSDKGQLPPKIQEWFIGDLLDEGECICGQDLDEHPEMKERLETLQKEVSHVSEENLEGKTEIPRILDDGDEDATELFKKREEIHELNSQIESIQKELQDIAEELKGYDTPDDDVDVSKLEEQRTELEEQKDELQEQVYQLKADISAQEDTVKEAKKAWKKEAEKQSEYQDMLRKIEFLEDTHADIERIKNKILGQIREETEARLDEYFNELIWKDEDYDIKLGENYTVSVLGPRGDNKIGSLSAGEKQVLALSFMSALTSISGFSAPIIIDTPLGRISGENKRRIANNLPDYLEGTQITFLMTDQEFDSDVEARLRSSIANEYELNFENEQTTIAPRGEEAMQND